MVVRVNSCAKINLGLCIGSLRADGFHALRTIYQTIALHDRLAITVERGSGIVIRCNDPRVPADRTNTCYRIAERVLSATRSRGRVVIEIEKRLPVQGGLGGASSNAAAVLLGLERALRKPLSGPARLKIAAEVGSDLPLFLLGGTVLGVGRGQEVYPLPDLPRCWCVVASPPIGVSTPQAFADWDRISSRGKLTDSHASDKMDEFSRRVSSWLAGFSGGSGKSVSGVPAGGRGRAETLLLDLVRTGIENDFERVVFPKHPELRKVKEVILRNGALYASLSGSGSAVYGLFPARAWAGRVRKKLGQMGIAAQVTATVARRQYWNKIIDC